MLIVLPVHAQVTLRREPGGRKLVGVGMVQPVAGPLAMMAAGALHVHVVETPVFGSAMTMVA
jgi:hypothetical protein